LAAKSSAVRPGFSRTAKAVAGGDQRESFLRQGTTRPTVGRGQQKVRVSFEYADESDPSPYPIPPNAPIEGGPLPDGDRHVIVLDRDTCRLYEP
jgi:hypothetical protein